MSVRRFTENHNFPFEGGGVELKASPAPTPSQTTQLDSACVCGRGKGSKMASWRQSSRVKWPWAFLWLILLHSAIRSSETVNEISRPELTFGLWLDELEINGHTLIFRHVKITIKNHTHRDTECSIEKSEGTL